MRVVIALVVVVLGGILFFTHFHSTDGPVSGETSDTLLHSILSYIPDNENSRAIAAINLYERAGNQLELEFPEENNTEQVVDYAFFLKTQGGLEKGPLISGFDENYTISLSVMHDNAGYDLRDVAASIWSGLGDELYEAVILNEPRRNLVNSMRDSTAWPSPDAASYGGVRMLSWGEELQSDAVQQFNPPVYNRLGQPARIAFMNSALLSSLRTSYLEAMVDAKRGNAPSLGSDPIYQELAAGAEWLNLYSMVLSSRTQSFQSASQYLRRITVVDEEYQRKIDELSQEPILEPYKAFATGIGKDDLDRFYMGLVLVHDDGTMAEQNADLLLQRLSGEGVTIWKKDWNELLNLDLAEVVVSGNSLLAKIPLAENKGSNIWRDWFYSQEFLLLHE